MGKFRAYQHYVDSGLDWLGNLPAGWKTERAKLIFKEINERSEDGSEQLLSVSEYYGVKPRSEVIEEGEYLSRAESLEGYKKCRVNDLVMNIMLAWKRGLAFTQFDGIVSPAYSVFRLKRPYDPDYLNYLLRTDIYTALFKRWSTGVIDSRLRLYPEVFGALPVVVPPPPEQGAIVIFLDHETAKIDRLIAKQERLIELLKEKRQAVISHAVTKGLNPDAPMKDSGVEWLGEVPAHWSVCDVKHVTSFITSGPRGWSDYISDQGDIFLQSGDLAGDLTIKWENAKKVVPTEGAEGIRTSLKKGDVLVCITGANTGNVGLVETIPGKAFINQHLAIVRSARAKTLPKYLAQCLISRVGQQHFSQVQYGLKEGLSLENVREAVVTLPPMNEQMKISQFIEAKRQKLDILHQKSFRSVELMKEHRTALISAAVTGKIDVRGWQKPNIEPEQTATAVSA